MDREKALEILARKLLDLEPLEEVGDYFSYQTVGSNLTSGQRLPLPFMVYLILVDILSYPCGWRIIEKTLWTVPVRFRGVNFLLEHGKFGLRVSATDVEAASHLLPDLLCLLTDAFSIADRVYAGVVEAKVASGAVTIPNQHHQLSSRYLFFRDGAIERFASEPPPKEVTHVTASGKPIGWTSDPLRPQREGFYYASAALDAYFSWLEHWLILAYPFAAYEPGKDNLLSYSRTSWGDKFTTIFDFDTEKQAHQLYDELVRVKRSFRNPLAHGGVDHEGGWLLVHFDRIGAIPATLSSSFSSSLFPITDVDFGDACQVFDRVVQFLAEGSMRPAFRYIDAGLDVAFDHRSVQQYRGLMAATDAELDGFIESQGHLADRWANMDW